MEIGDSILIKKLNEKIFAKDKPFKPRESDCYLYSENYVVVFEVIHTRMLLIEKTLKVWK